MKNDLKVRLSKVIFGDDIEFLLFEEGVSGHSFVEQLTIKHVESKDYCTPKPTFALERKTCQSLIDQLWDCGLRPSEGTGSAGSLKATENHLTDMRKIAFKFIDKGV